MNGIADDFVAKRSGLYRDYIRQLRYAAAAERQGSGSERRTARRKPSTEPQRQADGRGLGDRRDSGACTMPAELPTPKTSRDEWARILGVRLAAETEGDDVPASDKRRS
jgi:hypothetical protein